MKHLPKIFVVDDDPAVAKLIDAVLAPNGYDVKYFNSADAFMAHHHPTQVGCLLIDPVMLGRSGKELLQCVQESGSFLSVVIFSGLIEAGDIADPNGSLWLFDNPYEAATLVTMVADGVAGSFRRRGERHRRDSLS